MMTRTSKKQMQELNELLRMDFPNDMVYAAGEYNATSKAYIRHNGIVTEYKNNTEALEAVLEIMAEHDGF